MRWNITWTTWLFLIIISFAVIEGIALATGGTTLSRYVWNLSEAFPPFGWFAGFLTGFFVCHFWWGGIISFKKESTMRTILLIAFLLAALGQAEAKSKQQVAMIPLPRPIPVEKISGVKSDLLPPPVFIQAQNPDPLKTQQAPVTNVPPGGTVNVNVPPASQPQTDHFLQYIWMLIVSAIGTMFGIPQLKQAFGSQPLQLDASHPEVKKAIHDAILQLIQSGVLQAPVQAGLNLIPGIGGFLAGLEPTAKAALLKLLLAQDGIQVPAPAPPVLGQSNLPDDLFKKIEALIEAKLKGAQS